MAEDLAHGQTQTQTLAATEASANRAETVATLIRAVGAFAAAFAALQVLHYFPAGANLVLAGAAGIVMLISTTGAIAVYLVVVTLPLLHANPLVGIVLVVLGFAAMSLLGEHNGAWFFTLALAPVAARFGAAWTIPILAGFYLSATEGFVASLVACLLLELFVVMGQGRGLTVLGLWLPSADQLRVVARDAGLTAPLLSVTGKTPGFADFSWLLGRHGLLDVGFYQVTLSFIARTFQRFPILVIQPGIWGAVGALSGLTIRPPLKKAAPAAAALVVVLAALMTGTAGALGSGAPIARYGFTAVLAVLLLMPWLAIALEMRSLARQKKDEAEAAVTAATSPKSQEDVVELLRTIADAQDVIKEKFTQTATVLLTDLKEFSKMTHEQGSVPSAATVQRYRDILEPVIERHGGKGRPTGGDGMLAAFNSPDSAVEAAIDMQRTLARYNAEHPSANQILIRVGLDTGEVVFDKENNPFIGDALNVASRVMNLADAGQIYISRATMENSERSAELTWHYHGTRKLRGIAEDVTIYEILWDEGQQPKAPNLKRL